MVSTSKYEAGVYAGTVGDRERVGLVYSAWGSTFFRYDLDDAEGSRSLHAENVKNLRKVAVLDPEDEVVKKFLKNHPAGSGCGYTSGPIAEKIREQLAPPRMEEPGWGEKVTAGTKNTPGRQVWIHHFRGDAQPGTTGWTNGFGIYTRWNDLVDPEPVA